MTLQKLQQLRKLKAEQHKRELQRLANADVFETIGFEPVCKPRVVARLSGTPEDELPPMCGNCPQERFLNLPDEDMDVLYGGAGGGGKSASLLALVIRTCVRYPGIQIFWFRKTFPQLNQSVLRNLARYNFAKALGARWNGSKYELSFPGGSILTFAHAKNAEEAAALSSAEINMLVIDERTTMPPDVVDFLYTRVRSGVVGVPCLGIRAASNPGHVGHGVVKAEFVDATDYGTKEIIDSAGRRRLFIPAKATDNPYVGDYDKTLAGISDPDLRARIRDGDWSAMPDAAFPDWKRDRIVVPPFTVPDEWIRYGGLDYGWAAPSVYLAAAKDNDGRLWFYREVTMVQTPEREQARQILDANRGLRVQIVAADPAMWGKTGSALPPAEQMATEGLVLTKGDNDRLGGKSRMHTYLAEAPACAHHRGLGWSTCPMLHVIDGACPKFVQTMGDLPRDPHRPEDVDTDAPDHWYDACLIAGTIIATRRGDVPIEDVRIGDQVLTRKGWRRVRDSAKTGINKPVISVMMASGGTLTGTGNHPVFVAGRGFVPLDTLRYSDRLLVWQDELSQWSSTASHSGATLTPSTGRTGCTSLQAPPTSNEASTAFIVRSGSQSMAPSRQGATSIIETTIQATTAPTIWSASPTPTTRSTTPGKRSLTRSERLDTSTSLLLPIGTQATKVECGTPRTADACGPIEKLEPWSAPSVAKSLKPVTGTRQQGSVQQTAAAQTAGIAAPTTKIEFAQDAAAPSAPIGTQQPRTVRESVLGLFDAGAADVYNLSVEGEEEYFANGILVHNCRYLVMSIGGGPEFPILEEPEAAVAADGFQVFGQFAMRQQDTPFTGGWFDED